LSEEYDEAINSASASDNRGSPSQQSPWSVIGNGCGLGRWHRCQYSVLRM